MFTYAPVDCKSISSFEATNGVYHEFALDVDVWCPDVVVVVVTCMCVCVCVVWGGGALVGGGGGG